MSQLDFKDFRQEKRLFGLRAIQSGLLVIVLLLVVAGRMFYLQILMHDHYQTRSRDNRVKVLPLAPTRGLIYDANGVLLADNQPTYTLELFPEKLHNFDDTVARLRELIDIRETDIERYNKLRKRRRRFEGIPLRLHLSDEEIARIAINSHEFPEVRVKAALLRKYPLGELTAHVLGYVGRINEKELSKIDPSEYAGTSFIGKNGIEKSYEEILHGRVGLQQIEVNVGGRKLRVLDQSPATRGANLRLNLDIRLQRAAYDALGDYNGAAVAINPQTGGILALVSKPGMDPNLFVEGISSKAYTALKDSPDKPLFNRALRGTYPPGSTVKPFFGLAGLETHTRLASETTFCPGFYRLPWHSHKYRDWKKAGHGYTDLNKAIEQSCDVYFYTLAHSLGIDVMHDFMAQFGFGKKTGVDLPGEQHAILPSREWKKKRLKTVWYPGETLIMGIGQGYFTVTALQLASATATLAARGKHHVPRLVADIITPEGKTIAPPTPRATQIERKQDENWDTVIQAMSNVVEGSRGTARRIRNEHYRIAGKTGTAQVFTVAQDAKYDADKISKKNRDHALFMAFAPVENPQIAVAVIVENGGHGGSVAAPVAKAMMDAYLLDNTKQEPAR
ncbi:MAG: penicillin-binding protein 2 [gamma proteobacterium symbiont of Bathyaustriella thionipta]|nr:penicillin-binding protein 2 [gamma proteobacterium symbiont of Bathyaustriella thionipta]